MSTTVAFPVRNRPPFRADHVGSLLHPIELREARAARALGDITAESLREGELESADALKRRLDAAAKFLPLQQLALSPQCGFASTEDGDLTSEDQQWRKLERCVEVALGVWGSV